MGRARELAGCSGHGFRLAPNVSSVSFASSAEATKLGQSHLSTGHTPHSTAQAGSLNSLTHLTQLRSLISLAWQFERELEECRRWAVPPPDPPEGLDEETLEQHAEAIRMLVGACASLCCIPGLALPRSFAYEQTHSLHAGG